MNAEAEIIQKMKAQIAEMLDKQAEKQINERVKQFKEELARDSRHNGSDRNFSFPNPGRQFLKFHHSL